MIINYTFIFVVAKHFKQCQLSDPAFNECLKNGLQSAVPHLAKGNIKIKN